MDVIANKIEVIKFLLNNGYSQDIDDSDNEVTTFTSNAKLMTVEVWDEEIVFIDGTGDFLHLPLNYYALIGGLMEFRQIAINYIPNHYNKL